MNAAQTIEAMRAHGVPAGEAGLWAVTKWAISKPMFVRRNEGRGVTIAPGQYTNLHRWTTATLSQTCGELVMHDEPHELRKHLQFVMRARGHVLKTGLGLACVVRGLLVNPSVTAITVIERDADVIKLVGESLFRQAQRVPIEIVHADALTWCASTDRKFDCAWHDIWTDTCEGERELADAHARLICDMHHKVAFQGAWEFPRSFRRTCRDMGVI